MSYAANNLLVKLVRSASHPFRTAPIQVRRWSMTGHTMDGSVLNDVSERPGRLSRTPAVRACSSSSQPTAVGCATGLPG